MEKEISYLEIFVEKFIQIKKGILIFIRKEND
jgi:hypothetical protein